MLIEYRPTYKENIVFKDIFYQCDENVRLRDQAVSLYKGHLL